MRYTSACRNGVCVNGPGSFHSSACGARTMAALHALTAAAIADEVRALEWAGVAPVKREPAPHSSFLSHYTAFRGEPLVLEGAGASWPLLQGGAEAVLPRVRGWLEETEVEVLSMSYPDDLRFDAAARRPATTTFGRFVGRAEALAEGEEDRGEGKEGEGSGGRERKKRRRDTEDTEDTEYMQKLRIPAPAEPAQGADTGLRSLAESLIWPPGVPAAAGLEVKETNLWAGRCLTSQLHFDGYDNVHTVVSGEKLFVCFSPWMLEHLSPTVRRDGALNNTSDVTPTRPPLLPSFLPSFLGV